MFAWQVGGCETGDPLKERSALDNTIFLAGDHGRISISKRRGHRNNEYVKRERMCLSDVIA